MTISPPDFATSVSTLVDLLCQRAIHQPHSSAYTFLLDGETTEAALTYAELDHRARMIGARLREMEAAHERVMLLYPPGLEYIAAFFGCLYAGAVAVPAYPPNPARFERTLPRLQAIVRDATPKIVLTTSTLVSMADTLKEHDALFAPLQWAATDVLDGALAMAWEPPDIDGETLAFLQYTSGSTGTPKGVMLGHNNLLHNSALIERFFGHTPASRGVIWLPPYHDMGLIGGIIQPMYCGFPVTLLSPVDFMQRPLRWLEAITRYGATTSGGPNFAYDLCARKITPEQREHLDLSTWSVAFNGAEPVRAATLDRFADTFASCGFRRHAFFPCYGLAEGTLIVAGGHIDALPVTRSFADATFQDQSSAPDTPAISSRTLVGCGQAGDEHVIAIVDPIGGEPRPSGQIGEVWVSGPSVAQGYWRREADTVDLFAAHLPDDPHPYLRTGDLGFIDDTELFITGRIKDLIIIRGRNHYPQDIEQTVEQSHFALRPGSGAAFAIEIDGEERLIIVQEIERHHRSIAGEEIVQAIREAVAQQHELQAYGIALVRVGSIPKTSSGKIQRYLCRERWLDGSLQIHTRSVLDQQAADAATPGMPLADRLAQAATDDERYTLALAFAQEHIARLLGVPRIDPDQSLSVQGIDSLGAMQIQYALETQLGVEVPITSILRGLSLASLIRELLAQPRARTSIAAPTAEATPLSQGQQALWFLAQLAPDSAAYNVANAVLIHADLNVEALRRSFNTLVQRHAILRTTLADSPGGPRQIVHDVLPPDFAASDARDWDDEQLRTILTDVARQPFVLDHGPLLRVRLYRRAPTTWAALVVLHHTITDFWSQALLVDELAELYTAERTNQSIALPAPTQTYLDYARWQRDMLKGAEGERLWAYWQRQLAGEISALTLPFSRPRPAIQTYNGRTLVVSLDAQETARLKGVAVANHATLFMTLLAAFEALLHRYTGQDDFTVGTLTAGRDRASLAGTMGYFVNPLVLRARPSSAQPFTALLADTRHTVLGAFEHQAYPFSELVSRLRPVRDTAQTPLFQVMFIFQQGAPHHRHALTPFALGIPNTRAQIGDLPVEILPLEQTTAQFDLSVTMGEIDGTLAASFEYNHELFDEAMVSQVAHHYVALLASIAAEPSRPIGALPMLDLDELHQRRAATDGPYVPIPPDESVPSLVAAQAVSRPDAVAIVAGNDQITYHDLNQRADCLAAFLVERGVGPETVVCVCMDRHADMVVAMLGVLRAGGAYVPLDPTYPQERIASILGEIKVVLVLTQEHHRTMLLPHAATVLTLDQTYGEGDMGKPDIRILHPMQSACVIYTSGSTGRPHGVVLHHAGLTNLVRSFVTSFDASSADRMLPLTSSASASFVGEVWPILCSGGTLVLPSVETLLDNTQLFALIDTAKVTIISTVPALLTGLYERADDLASLRFLLSGGEALVFDAARRGTVPFTIVNGYGLTETTVCSTFYTINTADQQPERGVPIGRPVINTEVYILDAALNIMPVGGIGEIYVGGAGVARGYIGDPALTAQRFIPHPFKPGERVYRTGDLGRWRADGVIEYVHRIDQQVKIHGNRIELAEIEIALRRHPAVRDCLVVVETTLNQGKRLIAYVVADATVTSSNLHRWLMDRLPLPMIPSVFVLLDAFPITANGKVDRAALFAPSVARPALAEQFVAPRSALEQQVAVIWRDLLDLRDIGIHDNFFELGGNSLLIAQVHHRLRDEINSPLSLIDLFRYPTIHLLAQAMHQVPKEPTYQTLKDDAVRRRIAAQRRQHLVAGRLRSRGQP